MWPPNYPARERLGPIHGWLREAGVLDFVAVPIPGLDGRTFYEHEGRFWEMTPWMPGKAEAFGRPSPARVIAGYGALAAFHRRLAGYPFEGESPGLAARRSEVQWLLGGGLEEYRRRINLSSENPLEGPALEWIEKAWVEAPKVLERLNQAPRTRLQPCIRDTRPEHMLFTGDRLTGLIDFGAMGVDSVAADLARLGAEWLWGDRELRAVGLSAYTAVRPLTAADLALIDLFEYSTALLGPSHWFRWQYVTGLPFDDRSAASRGIEKGLHRLNDLSADRPSG